MISDNKYPFILKLHSSHKSVIINYLLFGNQKPNTMKAIKFTIILLLISSVSAFSQNKKLTFENENGKVEYEKLDGRFNGNYVSYHKNGQKKAEGKFENNCRKGVWKIWNEKGDVVVTKEYFSPFVTDMADAVSVKEFAYEKNEDGFIDFYPLVQKNVAWSKRLWRTIEKENNPELFKEDGLFSIFYILGTNGELKTYDTSSDEFVNELSLEKLSEIDPEKIEIVAYKIKEETFYDTERQVLETRIIGICPVAKKNGKTTDLFWVYYPAVRKYLGFQQVSAGAFNENVKSLDDLFFYRCYYGQITQSSNTLGNTIAELIENEEDQLKESERIELSIIRSEHDIWLKLAK